ncbi:MAG TPA: aspartate--tRNA ligase, partial [Thermoanaerobaculia bacterium]|nr:aspartate--tRNA ligase [Thermoanaerobaculia bacterium]
QRDFGDLIFIDLRDRSGVCQVVIDRGRGAGDATVDAAKETRSEFVVRIEGTVAAREEKVRNPKLPTGDIEVVASSITILNRADTPPFAIEDDTDAAEELRLQYRYLDLRRPALTRNLMLRHKVTFAVRDYMDRNGFLEIETPILTKSTPEGARDYLVPSRVHKGSFYALPQSPQIFKQLCMVSGLERYFQIARCFRDEDLRRDRQPEFTQIDVEASFIDEEFIYSLIEGMFAEVFPLAGIEVKTPFPRITWQESMDRFGMELIDITGWARDIDFAPFKVEANGSVRAIVIPHAASFTRRRIDELTEYAKKLGAGGLLWAKFEGGEPGASFKKFVDAGELDLLREIVRAEPGSLALIVSGKNTMVWDVLANLRLKVAKEEGLIPEDRFNFLWVTDFPLFEWDEESQRYFARHHPFTSPASVDGLNDPATAMARAYDVVLNGIELGGGSIRINQPDVQAKMFSALGISDEDAKSRFGFLLEAFRYGAPPHGGVALGVDRMLMMMARAESLRDVIAFPKTARAQDLMCDAPSTVDEKQLTDLGIAVPK